MAKWMCFLHPQITLPIRAENHFKTARRPSQWAEFQTISVQRTWFNYQKKKGRLKIIIAPYSSTRPRSNIASAVTSKYNRVVAALLFLISLRLRISPIKKKQFMEKEIKLP